MREIKFRAWLKKSSIDDEPWMVGPFDLTQDNRWIFEHEPILMQYTGLKDKNGQEIYEGDIVKGGFSGKNFEVIFKEGSFYAREMLLYGINPECKVIGNIYENPDLLKEPANDKK